MSTATVPEGKRGYVMLTNGRGWTGITGDILEPGEYIMSSEYEKVWVCGFGTKIVGPPDEDGSCVGCNGRQDLGDCGWRFLVDAGD